MKITSVEPLVLGTAWRNLTIVAVGTDDGIEGVGERSAFRELFERQAVDIVQPDITMCGCLWEARKTGPGLGVALDRAVVAEHPRRALYFDLHSTDWQLRQAETAGTGERPDAHA
jgi:hypothetical protein